MKVLIFTCLVVLSTISHAAALKWGVMNATTPINAPNGALVYLIQTEDSRATLLSSIANKTFQHSTALGTATVTDGYIYDANTAGNWYVADVSIPSDATYPVIYTNFYVLIYDTNNLTDAKKFLLSSTLSHEVKFNENNNPETTCDFSDYINGESTWTAIVPEPGVMSLLALGIAGVALRRKQA